MGRRWIWLLVIAPAACARAPISSTDEPLASLCRFDQAADARPVLATAAGTELALVGADGARTVAYRFDPAAEVRAIAARNGRVAAAAGWCDGGPQRCKYELVLIEGGAVRWHTLGDGWLDSARPLALDERGGFAVTLQDAPLRGAVLAPDGTARILDGSAPLGPPAADGALAVMRYGDDGAATWGWLGDDGAFAPAARPFAGRDAAWDGDRLIYLATVDGGLAVVAEHRGDVRAFALPAAALPSPRLAVRDGWALVSDGAEPRYRVRLADGARLDLAAPAPALRPFMLGAPALDDGGGLLLPLRDATLGALYRDDGAGVRAVSGGVRAVLAIDWASRGDTYVVQATNDRYGGELAWPPLPVGETAVLDGPGIEIARPADGTRRVLPEQWAPTIALSADGRCAAWWRGGALTALDAERDRAFVVDQRAPDALVVTPAWID